MRSTLPVALIAGLVLFATPLPGHAQRGGRGGGGGGGGGRQGAPIDLTGNWVSVISEDWEFRMVTPNKGIFETLTLNAEGRKIGESWDPARDEKAGEQCRGYGAANLMRLPTRLRITWENDSTLRIDTDAGTQTRLFRFGNVPAPTGEPTWQGHSLAAWEASAGRGARGGNLRVTTTNLRPGYVRKNGAPYSNRTTITEFYDLNTLPNGDQWITITTKVDDPQYFTRPLITTSDFKKLPDASGWNPTPCSVK